MRIWDYFQYVRMFIWLLFSLLRFFFFAFTYTLKEIKQVDTTIWWDWYIVINKNNFLFHLEFGTFSIDRVSVFSAYKIRLMPFYDLYKAHLNFWKQKENKISFFFFCHSFVILPWFICNWDHVFLCTCTYIYMHINVHPPTGVCSFNWLDIEREERITNEITTIENEFQLCLISFFLYTVVSSRSFLFLQRQWLEGSSEAIHFENDK